jgi:hypothetical protein
MVSDLLLAPSVAYLTPTRRSERLTTVSICAHKRHEDVINPIKRHKMPKLSFLRDLQPVGWDVAAYQVCAGLDVRAVLLSQRHVRVRVRHTHTQHQLP